MVVEPQSLEHMSAEQLREMAARLMLQIRHQSALLDKLTIGRALEFVPKERLFPCTNCGLAPMGRDVAWRKLQALAEGTKLAKERLATA